MKQLRELFARNSSRWLAIELILVTCACMWAFDPVIVTAYVTHQPMGYDPDQLVRMEVGCTKTIKTPSNRSSCSKRFAPWTMCSKPILPTEVQ